MSPFSAKSCVWPSTHSHLYIMTIILPIVPQGNRSSESYIPDYGMKAKRRNRLVFQKVAFHCCPHRVLLCIPRGRGSRPPMEAWGKTGLAYQICANQHWVQIESTCWVRIALRLAKERNDELAAIRRIRLEFHNCLLGPKPAHGSRSFEEL